MKMNNLNKKKTWAVIDLGFNEIIDYYRLKMTAKRFVNSQGNSKRFKIVKILDLQSGKGGQKKNGTTK